MKRPSLTALEIDMLLSCIGFVMAGEISGGPLQADSKHPKYAHDDEEHPEVKRRIDTINSASRKLRIMLDNRVRGR